MNCKKIIGYIFAIVPFGSIALWMFIKDWKTALMICGFVVGWCALVALTMYGFYLVEQGNKEK